MVFFVFLILVRIAFHCGEKFGIAIPIRYPRGHDAPKVQLPIVADFTQNDFYLTPINDGDDAPVPHGLCFLNFVLVALDPKLFECFFVLLIGR